MMFKKNYRWLIVIWLWIIGVVAYFDRVNFSIAAPGLSKELALDPAQLGFVMSAFGIGYLLTNFPGGVLTSRYKAYKVISAILVFWSIMTLSTGLAWSFASLVVIRILFGIFEGPLAPGSMKVIGNWTLPKDRGIATGIYVSALTVGVIIGNLVSVFIVSSWGWRMVFYIFGIGGVVIGLLTLLIMRDRPADHLGVSQEEKDLIDSSMAKYDGKVSSAGGSKLSVLLASPWSWILTITYFCITLALYANLNWLPTYFMKARGTTLIGAGINSSVPWIAMFIGMVLFGWLADKVGKKYKSSWTAFCLFLMVPSITYAVITPDITVSIIMFSISLFGVGGSLGLINSVNLEISKKDDVPVVSGMMVTGTSVAAIVAPILVGYILKETNSFNIAYYVFAAFAFLGGLLGLALYAREKKLRLERDVRDMI